MRCVVTGGAGFMGSLVVDTLIEQGHEVVIIDDETGGFKCNVNPKATWHRIPLEELPKGLLKGVDVVYHLAAFAAEGLSLFTPTLCARRNYISTSNLIAECIESGVETIVFTSSMAVYGDGENPPFDEAHLPRPIDPYGISKFACEQLISSYSRHFGINHVIIRPHNVFGVRQNLSDPYRNVIGIFISQILNDEPLTIFGDGLQMRAFSYVNEVVPCILRAAFTPEAHGKVINLGGATPRTILEIAKALLDISGREERLRYLPGRIGDVHEAYCTTALSEKLLGYEENVVFKDALAEMFEWSSTIERASKGWRNDAVEISRNFYDIWTPPGDAS